MDLEVPLETLIEVGEFLVQQDEARNDIPNDDEVDLEEGNTTMREEDDVDQEVEDTDDNICVA